MTDAHTSLDAVCAAARTLASVSGRPRRVRVQIGETAVEIEWDGAGEHVPAPPHGASTSDEPAGADIEPALVVTSPMVGTFYHAPEPGAAPFVRVGDQVRAGEQVGILEAMKLMNAVVAEIDGCVAEILVSDAAPVEFEQPLIALARA
jgi:acetyl-CoA carboxylase biotin carboxyl carrier protein